MVFGGQSVLIIPKVRAVAWGLLRFVMNYCSKCGLPISLKWIEHERRQRYACASCGITHYQNPTVIVGCLVCWNDKVLMCRRSEEPARGQWMVPSGFLECGETLEEGAARETLEETGVIVDPASLDLCSVMNMTAISQIAIAFRVRLMTIPQIRPGPECLEVAFLSEDEIPRDQFAWLTAMGTWPKRFFNELRSHDFTIQMMTIGSNEGIGFRLREYQIGTVTVADVADA
jgi:ADP-ribose pyrophosphatase YjhB (NUDIX family)